MKYDTWIVDRKALVALEYSIKNCCKAIIQLLIYFRKHRRREHEIVGEFSFWLINRRKRNAWYHTTSRRTIFELRTDEL